MPTGEEIAENPAEHLARRGLAGGARRPGHTHCLATGFVHVACDPIVGTLFAIAMLALTTNSSALTCIANDRDFNAVFARQVEATLRRPVSIVVPSLVTARVQEAHIFIGRMLCALLEKRLANAGLL
jgi:hypothetical protein